ncbi:MAG: ImmA/IrrE family metallo-endopeptidase [Schaedlerella sp.]|nr:ImmA/IrrE family metallo-endopeptidase [Ruminococcus sp.]NBI98650.1 ImmA/IrrE family metallo-endopeptidase [Lachnospiraceae bacterium]
MWYIFNNYNCIQRQRWTIFHEIGHIYLEHFEGDFMTYKEKEAEALFC